MPTLIPIALATALVSSAPAPSQQAFVDALAEFRRHLHAAFDAEGRILRIVCQPEDRDALGRTCAKYRNAYAFFTWTLEDFDTTVARASARELRALPHTDANAPPDIRTLHEELRDAILMVTSANNGARIAEMNCVSLIADAQPGFSRDFTDAYGIEDDLERSFAAANAAHRRIRLHLAPADRQRATD